MSSNRQAQENDIWVNQETLQTLLFIYEELEKFLIFANIDLISQRYIYLKDLGYKY